MMSPVAACLGVPAMRQSVASESPGGRLPLSRAHEYGVTPPVTAHAASYATPVSPTGRPQATDSARLNTAVISSDTLPVTTQASVPLHPLPLHPPKRDPAEGTAVSATAFPVA